MQAWRAAHPGYIRAPLKVLAALQDALPLQTVDFIEETAKRTEIPEACEIPALQDTLHDGPEILGSKPRDEIALGIRTLHVARHGRKGRHFVVFRVADEDVLDVLRLLHDSMDLARHLPAANEFPH